MRCVHRQYRYLHQMLQYPVGADIQHKIPSSPTPRAPATAIFKILHSILYPGVGAAQVKATWFNGLAHRVFYHYHDDPKVIKKITKLIQKKFDRLRKPDILVSQFY